MQSILADFRLFTILVIIAILLICFDGLNVFSLPKSLVQYITSPLQYGIYHGGLGLKTQFEFVYMARKASQENVALRQQMGGLLTENATLRKDLTEKNAMLVQGDTLNPTNYHLIPARTLGLTRYLLIDRGSDDGIKVDQPVIYKDAYIGQIREVSQKKSTVILLSDPDSKIASFVSSQDGKAKGLLIGQYGSEILLDKVLHSEPMAVNDLIYSDGTEGILPRGLVLGQVQEIIQKDNDVFKQAKVKSIFNVADLDVVFVITD